MPVFRVQMIDEDQVVDESAVSAAMPEDAVYRLTGERLVRGKSGRRASVLRAKVYWDSLEGLSLVRLYNPAPPRSRSPATDGGGGERVGGPG